jgi:hypothetical protein
MKKIDVIIDALSVAQNSVWSTLNQEALAYAIELKLELAKPEQTKYSDIVSVGGLDPRNKFDAQPEQEPVAWMVRDQVDGCRYPSALKNPAGSINGESKPLYITPPPKPWVGLTEHEIWECQKPGLSDDVYKLIETKLKEKNT